MNALSLYKIASDLNANIYFKGSLLKKNIEYKKLLHNVSISQISSPNNILPNSIVFIAKQKLLSKALSSNNTTALLLDKNIKMPSSSTIFTLVCKDPKAAFHKLLDLFNKPPKIISGIHPSAYIGQNVSLGQNVTIMPFSTIEDNVKISDNVIIYPNAYIANDVTIKSNSTISHGVSIHHSCIIGKNVFIGPHSVIGNIGFGYHKSNNNLLRTSHIGIVNIEDNVDIGALVTIDRATLGQTFIGSGTKIDSQVHIAHNCYIGNNCIIAGQSGLAGSVTLEDNVSLAGDVGIVDHVRVEKYSTVLAKSMVHSNIKPYSTVFGYPARPLAQALKIHKAILKLILPKKHKKNKISNN